MRKHPHTKRMDRQSENHDQHKKLHPQPQRIDAESNLLLRFLLKTVSIPFQNKNIFLSIKNERTVREM